MSVEYVSITIEFKTKVERFLFHLNYLLKDIVCCIGHYQAKREESVNFIIIDEIIKQFVNNKKNKQMLYLPVWWWPCEQNNHIINVYTMITIMCVWFKTYMTNTDKWHELEQVNWELKYLEGA